MASQMGMHRTDLGDGTSLLSMPYDEGLMQKAVKQPLEDRTGTPDPDTETEASSRGGGEAGPIRRFNDVFTDIGSTYLEALGMDGFEVSKSIQTRRDELFRNKFPLVVPRFTVKCEECGAEYDEERTWCDNCKSGDLREPDPSEKREAHRLFESVNKEGQSLRELWKMLEDDHGRLGVTTLVIKYDYTVASGDETVLGQPIMEEGQIIRKDVDELVRGDPKRIVPVTDENGRVGGWKWTCPIHRSEQAEENPGTCDVCGAEKREIFYVEKRHVRSTNYDKYWFEDEVLSYAHFYPRQNGLDGLSPVHHVWTKQAILHWMDIYAGAFYDPNSKKYPNKFMVVHTTNADAWERNFDRAEDQASENLYANQIFVNEYATDSQSTPELQVVDFMDDTLKGQDEAMKKAYKSDIRTQFGVTDVFDSELEDAGGLNNEGLQLEVTDRSIAAAQHDLMTGPLDELMKRIGLDDHRLAFVPPREKDLDELEQKVGIGERASKAGLEAEWQDNDVDIKDGEFDAEAAGGGLGDLMGGGGDEGAGGDVDGEGSLFEQAVFKAELDDEWLAPGGVYTVLGDDGTMVGIAVDMPESDVYVDWRREAFDDELDNPHVSVYGSIDDLKQATGNDVEPVSSFGGLAPKASESPWRDACNHLSKAFSHTVWPSDLKQKAEPYWNDDEDVPEEVKEAIDEAIYNDGAIFDDIDGLSATDELMDFFAEKLKQPQGWSQRSVAQDLVRQFNVPEEKADVIASTELASILNNARDETFEKLEEDVGETLLFKWIGPGNPDDGRTTEACEEMKLRTDPKFGGTPRPLDELIELEKEVHDKYFPELSFRKHVLHPHERHTYTEATRV